MAEVLLNHSAILSSALQLAQASGLAEGHCRTLSQRSDLVKPETMLATSIDPGPGFCLSEARQAVLYIGRSRWLLHAVCQSFSPWHNRLGADDMWRSPHCPLMEPHLQCLRAVDPSWLAES